MSYCTIKIDWLPDAGKHWKTFTAVHREAGHLGSWLVERQATARQQSGKRPSQAELQKEIKRQFPCLDSQSAPPVVADDCQAIAWAESLRKHGEPYAYPHPKLRHRQVLFPNQGAQVRNGKPVLSCGTAGRLTVRIPKGIVLAERLRDIRLDYGCVELGWDLPAATPPRGPARRVDLSVNTVIAATDGEQALLSSGREIKSTLPLGNQWLAESTAKQASKKNKATRKVAEAFAHAKAYVGRPFNDAAQQRGRRQAQTVSSTCNRKLIALLHYKLAGGLEVDEAYTSQSCPVCGERSKHQRLYPCPCGFVAPRALGGGTNIRTLGIKGALRPNCSVPHVIQWKHPSKYPSPKLGSHADTIQVAWESSREAMPL
jgi:predicted RNA-binding Zn-ribbon protein involved in translation (DUF1610 family)